MPGFEAQRLLPDEYSEKEISSKLGFSHPSTYTFAHPPTSCSPGSTIEPSRRTKRPSCVCTDTPASMPRKRGLRCALFVKVSLPVMMLALTPWRVS